MIIIFAKSIVSLWLFNNALQKLPRSIENCTKLREIRCDANPMRSPPFPVLRGGVHSVIKYRQLQRFRIIELKRLLRSIDLRFFTGTS